MIDLTLNRVTSIRARRTGGPNSFLILEIESKDGPLVVSVFPLDFDDVEDDVAISALAQAINTAQSEHPFTGV